MNLERMQKELRFLKGYAAFSTILFAVGIFLAAKGPSKHATFDEIDAHRINILEPNGTKRLVLANGAVFPGGSISGVPLNFRRGERGAGILFYNDEGDEVGGLVYSGKMVNGKIDASGTIRFDHFRQNEAVGMSYSDEHGVARSGLEVWDVPPVPISAEFARQFVAIHRKGGPGMKAAVDELAKQHKSEVGLTTRVFVGRTPKDAAAVLLMDTTGKPRIRMAVDKSNAATLQFLDDKGKVVFSLPKASSSSK